jgi:hypothetical protein
MTNQEMNEALALFEGLERHVVPNHDADGPIPGSTMVVWTEPGEKLKANPYWNRKRPADYCSDLNFTRRVIMQFDDEQMLDYVRYMTEPNHCDQPSFQGYAEIAEATPWQCAKCILQTIGKWPRDVPHKRRAK